VQFAYNSTVAAPTSNTFLRVVLAGSIAGGAAGRLSAGRCERTPPGDMDGLVMGANAIVLARPVPTNVHDEFPAGWDNQPYGTTVTLRPAATTITNCLNGNNKCPFYLRLCAWARPLDQSTCPSNFDDTQNHRHKKCLFWICSTSYDWSHEVPVGCKTWYSEFGPGRALVDFGLFSSDPLVLKVEGKLGAHKKIE